MTSSDSAPAGNRSPDIQRLPGRSGPVCVLGLGLIGGSLLRDLSAQGIPTFGWNRSTATVNAASSDGFDVSSDLLTTLTRAEEVDALIVLSVPVPALPPLLRAIATHAPTCGLTDVTSVKSEVARLVEQHGLSSRFVGSHPMAGTAHSGWDATMEGLFVDAVWVVATDGAPTAQDNTPEEAVSAAWLATWCRVIAMATHVGSVVVPARAQDHDHAVARISHLPHVLAEAMAITANNGGALALSLAASSFRDATRVAGTSPELVRAMCENNRDALVEALDETMELLATARNNLADPASTISELVAEGHTARLHYEAHAAQVRGPQANNPAIVLHPETPGWLDQLRYAEATGSPIELGKD